MDRRDFLWSVSAAGVGTAAAVSLPTSETHSTSKKAPAVASPQYEVSIRKVAAQNARGVLPFTLAKFADDYVKVMGQKRIEGRPLATLSPIKDVQFNGFARGAAGAYANERIDIAALHRADDGALMRHELWSHRPMRNGGTSNPVLFTAHDDAFVGFDVMHTNANGVTTQGVFNFAAGGGALLNPGIYVIAGSRAATGLPPELDRFDYSGHPRTPIAESLGAAHDFAYLSFVVHGEWV
jgi:hypothetical protein